MGKGDELWDDSALLNAFDDAISKYKKYHGKEGQEKSADSGDVLAHSLTAGILLLLWRKVMEYQGRWMKLGKVHHNLQSSRTDYALHHRMKIILQDYNELLSQYYELEEKKQKVLEQLQQLGGYYYQDPAEVSGSASQLANCSTFQDHSVPAANQTYASVACICTTCCPYASHCPAVSCCGGKLGTESAMVTCRGKSCPLGESDMVKTAMEAAERAMLSMKGKSSDNNGVEGEEKQGKAHGPTSGTDLCNVLNAWYSAGFFTAKLPAGLVNLEQKEYK
ncbi:unnamed protein product [Linum trigynum]|uniref:Survival Motor Neuron Gemin2-binding domain-containing protein n=1 Tax=Linum trigynum TaxID=586398 RepID=A0AAV2DRR0_9ROSI